MNHATQNDQQNKKRREWEPKAHIPTGNKKKFEFISNASLHNQIIDIVNQRHRSMSNTIRTLLYLGIEQYNLNQLAGVTTGAKRQQESATKTAQAKATAAQREARKNKRNKSDVAPAVTPLLYGMEDETE